MIKVTDNFLTEEEFKNINLIYDPKFIPWSFQSVVHDTEFIGDIIDNWQLSYMILPDCIFYNCLMPLFDKMDMDVHFRVKLNLNPKAPAIREHGYHIDIPVPSKTAIFYLNTNNGYTKFETGEKVESVANRLVTFPSNLKHTGTTCTDVKGRLVLNVNYAPKNQAELAENNMAPFQIVDSIPDDAKVGLRDLPPKQENLTTTK
tara:strand:- start:248 stop:856 length:609 start_codon:yes stop_codon:yes gene_type:complete